ncbi:putative HTH transcriptional regulator [Anaerosolibacter carboniphilus]|uniref:Putative HTH transcriptional regulator n=1 Tax=Anaerosolibacter carboniphilus TaxID=1417629 RepID=A0A841L6U2_9FIRM|nr:putative HTH transcriptional regulator [Anaerosolibacter carboniphilus]
MANSSYIGNKYLILGIKDKPGEDREICGIDANEFIDSSVYQNVIMQYIEPELRVDYFPINYLDKKLGVVMIHEGNNNRPYIVKKKYSYGQKVQA